MSALVELAGRSRLEHARADAFSSQATIEDVAHLLCLLGSASLDDLADHADKDMQRAMALGSLQGMATCLAQSLRQFDVHTRCAPPDALRDLVAEALQPCVGSPDGCLEDRAPWEDMACDTDCKNRYLRSVGE